MRIANLEGRLVVLLEDGAVDVAEASGGRFASDPQDAFGRWDELLDWEPPASAPRLSADPARLGPPVPRPAQVFAIGMNYSDHAAEGGVEPPRHPPVFTKFPSCLAGPRTQLAVTSQYLDWEIELVVVIGRRAFEVAAEQAWEHVAGLTVGQDITDRRLQMRKPAPAQYSLGKSLPGFGPMGPAVVSVDELEHPDDLELSCVLSGQQVQKGRTSQMIFPVPELIARLSALLPLLPGDVIFTGTPAGIGAVRTPPRWLSPGDELVSTIEGLGTIRTSFVDPPSAS